jgi:hypothetical protein
VRAHGEAGWTARLVPLTVDGLIYASSMVMLECARRKAPVPALARWLLGLGMPIRCSRRVGYQSPSLDRYAAGAALTLLTRGLYQNYQAGIVTRGQPIHDPAVTMMKTAMGTPEAKVTDCSDDSRAAAYYKSPASPLQASHPGGRQSTRGWSRSTACGK